MHAISLIDIPLERVGVSLPSSGIYLPTSVLDFVTLDRIMASKIMSDTNRDDTKASTANESIHESGDNLKNYGSAPGVVEDVVRVVDHKAERALCRRFDLRLLPVLAVMCESCPLRWGW